MVARGSEMHLPRWRNGMDTTVQDLSLAADNGFDGEGNDAVDEQEEMSKAMKAKAAFIRDAIGRLQRSVLRWLSAHIHALLCACRTELPSHASRLPLSAPAPCLQR